MSIIVAGDLHGDWGHMNDLINKKNPDVILQCGDFGYWPKLEVSKPVLYGNQKPWKLQGIKCKETQVLWCDGNHEDHWSLKENDPNYDNVIYCPRGAVRTLLDGRTVLFIGGADSIDKDQRTLGIDWFPEEVISYKDYLEAIKYQGKVDIVISHTCPREFNMDSQTYQKITDPSRAALSAILTHFRPDLWYFGHWHENKVGQYNNTRWESLDYPGHGGKWWTYLK